MKRFIAVISVLMAVLTASAAFAVVQDFGEYTVDVIDGWTAVRQGETVYFVKNDNSASWSVMISELPGNAILEQYAKDVMKQLKGSDFKFDGRSYSFKFKNANGQKSDAVITSISGKKFMQWGIAGAETAGKDLERLINSFSAKKSSGGTVKTLSTKYFTFAVPKGWNGYEIDETSVKVENKNETASMYLEIEDFDGWEADDLAEFYAKEHKAKDLEKKNGTYSFTYEEDGKLNVATLGIDKQVYILIIQTAKDKAGFNEIAKLRGLMKRK